MPNPDLQTAAKEAVDCIEEVVLPMFQVVQRNFCKPDMTLARNMRRIETVTRNLQDALKEHGNG